MKINLLKEKLQILLENSIKDQTQADVPVAILLSGGIDSSLITSIASKANNKINIKLTDRDIQAIQYVLNLKISLNFNSCCSWITPLTKTTSTSCSRYISRYIFLICCILYKESRSHGFISTFPY